MTDKRYAVQRYGLSHLARQLPVPPESPLHTRERICKNINGRRSAPPAACEPRFHGFRNYRVFLFGNVTPAGPTEIKDQSRISLDARAAEVAFQQAPHIFGQRDTQITGTPARPALSFGSGFSTSWWRHHNILRMDTY